MVYFYRNCTFLCLLLFKRRSETELRTLQKRNRVAIYIIVKQKCNNNNNKKSVDNKNIFSFMQDGHPT